MSASEGRKQWLAAKHNDGSLWDDGNMLKLDCSNICVNSLNVLKSLGHTFKMSELHGM